MPLTREQLLALDDDHLLRQCRLDRFRATGPGGQHRNTTDSAVRLTLNDDPEVSGMAVESRSQHQNRRAALARLRLAIALAYREEPAGPWRESWQLNESNPDYARLTAAVFDALAARDYAVGEAAVLLGTSTGRLVRWLAGQPALWAEVNRQRHQRGLRPLTP